MTKTRYIHFNRLGNGLVKLEWSYDRSARSWVVIGTDDDKVETFRAVNFETEELAAAHANHLVDHPLSAEWKTDPLFFIESEAQNAVSRYHHLRRQLVKDLKAEAANMARDAERLEQHGVSPSSFFSRTEKLKGELEGATNHMVKTVDLAALMGVWVEHLAGGPRYFRMIIGGRFYDATDERHGYWQRQRNTAAVEG